MPPDLPWLFSVALSFGHGLALMALVSVCFGTLERISLEHQVRSVLNGLVFGSAAMLMMSAPASLAEGVIIDARSVIVGFGSVFAGLPAAIISAVIAIAFRLSIGGQGAEMGALGIALAAIIGLLWRRHYPQAVKYGLRRYALLGLALSVHVVTLAFIPGPASTMIALEAFLLAAPIYAIAGMIMGSLMQRESLLIQKEKALHTRTQTDQLTNIANRRLFVERINTALDNQANGGECFAILMIDVDHFKVVNDTHGHLVGDETLVRVADVLRTSVGPDDLAARYGGEEFAILLCNVSPRKAVAVADRIRVQIEQLKLHFSDAEFSVTVSIGVATSHGQVHTMSSLLSEADTALYAAKNKGRNRVEFRSELIELSASVQGGDKPSHRSAGMMAGV